MVAALSANVAKYNGQNGIIVNCSNDDGEFSYFISSTGELTKSPNVDELINKHEEGCFNVIELD